MIYVSLKYYVFIVVLLLLYYVLPLKYRWYILLIGSAVFYNEATGEGRKIFLFTIALSYISGFLLYWLRKTGSHIWLQRMGLFFSVGCIALPLIVTKQGDFVLQSLLHQKTLPWIVPLGLSFYSLQIISYLADIYMGRIEPQRNIFKYALYVSFFPLIVQGPISRYQQLSGQLYEGHAFEETGFVKGLYLIIWGFFLKLMIADKAGVVVDTVFGNSEMYAGCYIFIAGVLYSIQLYADFYACVTISQGVAGLFGIKLADNFHHPYFSDSMKEFWRRWHISLSSWLRDYIYIPLGGSRKGIFCKYRNLILTFAVSGIWHGAGYKYLFWGLMHAGYQIVGEITRPWRNRIYQLLDMDEKSLPRRIFQTAGTCFWVMLAWIIFRADSLRKGLAMLRSMFTTYNPWILFDDSLFRLGLSWKEWNLLLFSVFVLFLVSMAQEKYGIRDMLLKQHLVIRWSVSILAIVFIWVFGTYGFGFQSQDFIYGGF